MIDKPMSNERVTNAVLAIKMDRVIAKLEELSNWQRADHDVLTRHDEKITTLFHRVREVDKARKLESRIIGLVDGFAALAVFFANRINL